MIFFFVSDESYEPPVKKTVSNKKKLVFDKMDAVRVDETLSSSSDCDTDTLGKTYRVNFSIRYLTLYRICSLKQFIKTSNSNFILI